MFASTVAMENADEVFDDGFQAQGRRGFLGNGQGDNGNRGQGDRGQGNRGQGDRGQGERGQGER